MSVHAEEEIMNRASKSIADEIDFEILTSMLINECGWARVILDTIGPDVNNWLHIECKHHWKHRGKTWVFENKDEAALFRLTWA